MWTDDTMEKSSISIVIVQTKLLEKEEKWKYQNPEEESDLKWILKENEVDELENNLWPMEPKEFIRRCDYCLFPTVSLLTNIHS